MTLNAFEREPEQLFGAGRVPTHPGRSRTRSTFSLDRESVEARCVGCGRAQYSGVGDR